MGRKRPVRQKSKGRGSHGAKATYKVHARCVGCGVHQPVERLNGDKVCPRCLNGTSKSPVYS